MGKQINEKIVAQAACFAREKLMPVAAKLDEENRPPYELMDEMAAEGFFGMRYPKEWGGGGHNAVTTYLSVAELARGSAGVALLLLVHWMAVDTLLKFGTEAQKSRWLPDMIQGKKIAAFTISEAQAGSDAAGITTVAAKTEGGYILNGAKYFCTNGGIAELYVIAAKTNPEAGGRGISLFVIEKGTPGFVVTPPLAKMGCRSSATTALAFRDCYVSEDCLLGAENGGFKAAMYGLVGGRLGMGAMGLGVAEAAMKASLSYANRRMAFGAPLARIPAVQAMAADMHIKVQAVRNMLLAVTEKQDAGEDFSMDTSVLKAFAAEAVSEVCHKALQIYGGHGYVRGNPAERYYRDGRLMDIGVGATEVLKQVIGTTALKNCGKPE